MSHHESLPWLMLVPFTDLKPHPPVTLAHQLKAYSERDAALECLADLDQGRCRSLREYARLFGWGEHSGHKRVQRFLQDKLHLRIHWDLPSRTHRFEATSMLYHRFRKDKLLPSKPSKPTQADRGPLRDAAPPRPTSRPKADPAATQDPYSEPKNPNMLEKRRRENSGAVGIKEGVFREDQQEASPRLMPKAFGWNQALADWAAQRYPNIPIQRFRHYVEDVFIPWCRAKGYRYLDFIQACIAWINRELQKPRGGYFKWPNKRDSDRNPPSDAPSQPNRGYSTLDSMDASKSPMSFPNPAEDCADFPGQTMARQADGPDQGLVDEDMGEVETPGSTEANLDQATVEAFPEINLVPAGQFPADSLWIGFLDHLRRLGVPAQIHESLGRGKPRWRDETLIVEFANTDDWTVLDCILRQAGSVVQRYHLDRPWLPFAIEAVLEGPAESCLRTKIPTRDSTLR